VSISPQLIASTEVGPPLGHAFAVDAKRGVAWLADWGALRRVELSTREVRSFPTGPWRALRDVCVGPDGAPLVLAEVDTDTTDPKWRAPAPGTPVFGVLRLEGENLRPIARAAGNPVRAPVPPAISLSCAEDGTFVGPHDRGLGIYRASGELERVLPAQTTKYHLPYGAIDESGGYVAVTRGDGRIVRFTRPLPFETVLEGPFTGVDRLQVRSDGAVWFIGNDHHLHRLNIDGELRSYAPHVIQSFALSSDGATVFVGQSQSGAGVLDVATGQLRAIRSGNIQSVKWAEALYVRTSEGDLLRIEGAT
jgi:hypothetical protein